MKKNIIEKLLEDDSYKEIKISLLVKYIKNKTARSQVNALLPELIKYAGDLDLASIILKGLMKYEDSIKSIKENLEQIISNVPCGWGLINDLVENKELREEMLKKFPSIVQYTAQYKNGKYNTFYTANLIEDFTKIEAGQEIIEKNLLAILQNPKIRIPEKRKILKNVSKLENIEEFIEKNFKDLIKIETIEVSDIVNCLRSNSNNIELIFNSIKEIRKKNKSFEKEDFLLTLLRKFDFEKDKNKKYQTILRNLYYEVLEDEGCIIKIPLILEEMKEIEGLKDVYEENSYILKNFYETIPTGEDAKNIISDKELYNRTIGILIKEKQQYKLKAIMEELQGENEEEKPEYASNGNFSMNYKVYGKRLKLGYEKQTYKIPYHPRIMYPIFRQKYHFADIDQDLYLEIYEEGENDQSKITDEELAEVYLELREAGLFWSDAHKRNLVRLKKDNKVPDYVIKNDHKMFGFEGKNQEHKVLKKGEVVICDVDSIAQIAKEDNITKEGDYHYEIDESYIIEWLKNHGEKAILEAEIKFQENKEIQKTTKMEENNKQNRSLQEQKNYYKEKTDKQKNMQEEKRKEEENER